MIGVARSYECRLVDDLVSAYVEWREECAEVWRAYRQWERALAEDARAAYAAYAAALEREEAAAGAYRRMIERVNLTLGSRSRSRIPRRRAAGDGSETAYE